MAQWPFHFLSFFLSFFVVGGTWAADHLLLRTELKAAVFWIIHFLKRSTLLETFGRGLKAYLGSWRSVTFSHNRAKIVMDPPERRGYGSYLRMSVCVASSFNFSLFPSNAKTLSYTQRSASYHLYHYPAWHRDWLLPYHMADWILCAAGGFAGGFLCSICTLCPAV